jgi:hypothetical protein
MTQRITDAQLYAKTLTVNHLLGFEVEDHSDLFLVDGSVTLDFAYGGVMVVQYVGPNGGETNLSERGTKREALIYLNGLIKGLDMARKMCPALP